MKVGNRKTMEMEIDQHHKLLEDEEIDTVDIRTENIRRRWWALQGPPDNPPTEICEVCGQEDCGCDICEKCQEKITECECPCIQCNDYKRICNHYYLDDICKQWLPKGGEHD